MILNDLLVIALLIVAAILLNAAWVIFCVTRAAEKTRQQRREIEIRGVGMKYSHQELYDIGNPFSSYKGRSNW